MVDSRKGRFSAEAPRPPNTTGMTPAIAVGLGDEGKNPASQESPQSEPDKEGESKKIRDAAWGKHGKCWMWLGYETTPFSIEYHPLTFNRSIALMWTIL